jgi:hypothetical protein
MEYIGYGVTLHHLKNIHFDLAGFMNFKLESFLYVKTDCGCLNNMLVNCTWFEVFTITKVQNVILV